MKRIFLGVAFIIGALGLNAQNDKAWKKEVSEYQTEMNRELMDSTESPLPKEELATFKGLEFYKISKDFKVKAWLVTTPDSKPFEMSTSTERAPKYRLYGYAIYQLDTLTDTLDIYQNLGLIKQKQFKDHLFLPFGDLTNGLETYGGGRYLDLLIPKGDTIILDFNMAYNPYCVYNYKFSCPIPPRENFVNAEIRAGVKSYSPD